MHVAAEISPASRRTRRHRASRRVVAMACGLVTIFAVGTLAAAAEAPVGLGTSSSFAVLGGTTVTNTGPTVVSGDLGVSPGSAVTGFPPGLVNNGTIHAADALALQAQTDVTIAYNDAAGRASSAPITADLAGQTLVGGVHTGGSVALNGALTLDGQGDPNAVFIFQVASTLITGSASAVVLIGGAQACNVFWQVGSSATLGTASSFSGTILALTSISAMTGATVAGRLFARNGAVTLDTNTVTRPTCATGPGTTTTSEAVPTSTSTSSSTSTTLSGPIQDTTTTAVASETTTTVALGAVSTTTGSTTSTTAAGATTTTASTTSTAVGAPTTSTPAGDTTTLGRPSLPVTGGSAMITAVAALLAIVGGSTALVASRRRT